MIEFSTNWENMVNSPGDCTADRSMAEACMRGLELLLVGWQGPPTNVRISLSISLVRTLPVPRL